MEFRKNNDVLILEDHQQLRILARLLRNREEPLMLALNSEYERVNYLIKVNDAHDNLVDLLSQAQTLLANQSHPIKSKIAKEMEMYMIYAANWTMQCVRNCCVRVTCLEKIKAHFDAMVKELQEVDVDNKDEVDDLIALIELYKHRMWEYGNTSRSTYARAQSKAFSQALMLDGLTMEQLILRTKNRLGYKEDFEDLEEHQKLEVYEDVILESGRAKFPPMYKRKFRKPGLGDIMDAYGVAVLVVQAGVLVWDIYTAEHDIESALREAMALLSDAAEFSVKLAVNAKVTHLVAKKVSKLIGMLTASVAGFVAGAIAGFIFTLASGALLDAIFGSPGSREVPDMENLKFHTAEMPDGMELAFELSHGRLLEE